MQFPNKRRVAIYASTQMNEFGNKASPSRKGPYNSANVYSRLDKGKIILTKNQNCNPQVSYLIRHLTLLFLRTYRFWYKVSTIQNYKVFSKPNGVVSEVYFLNKSTFNVFCASGKQDTLFGDPFPNSIVHDPLQFGEKRKQFPNR